MEISEFIKLIRRKGASILTIVFVATMLTVGISLLFPLKYATTTRLLIIPKTGSNDDPYALSRSNEYLGKLFSEVARSGSFFNLVLASSYQVDKNYFYGSYSDQLKKWRKTVNTKTLADTGIVNVSVYHPNPRQAQQIALAVNDIMINKNDYYQGGEGVVKISIIDQPLLSNYPVKPNIPKNIALSLFAGLIFALGYIYIFPEERYDIKLWPKRGLKRAKSNSQQIKINYYPLPPEAIPTAPSSLVENEEEYSNSEFQPQGSITNVLK